MRQEKDYRVLIIFIWLFILTGLMVCDKININRKVKTIILPPPLEVLEVEKEGVVYDLQSNI
jgi:hypothetical protein